MTQTVTDAVAKRDNTTAFLKPYLPDFRAVLPTHINAEQWIRLTTGVLRRNPKLAQIAASNPGSLLAALLDAARLGLEIGETYHLVPFGNEVVGIADYTGLLELAYRAGEVAAIKCEIVYERDGFEYEPGTMDRPMHRPDWFAATRGKMIGAYAYAEMKGGAVSQVVVRSASEIEQVRKVSRGSDKSDSPWRQWPDRMWRKTVLRELMKYIPTSAEYRREKVRVEAEVARVAQVHDLPPAPTDLPDVDGEVVEPEWPETAQPGGAE